MKNIITIFLMVISTATVVVAQSDTISFERVIYKKIDTTQLEMRVFLPPQKESTNKYPAMVFFSGGGWYNCSMTQFEHQARYFAERGIACFLVEYRVWSTHRASIFDCIADAKSSMRYIKENADRFNIEKNKIIAAGGSSGGHLAAATAMTIGYDDPNDNLSISSKPNALILFNPVIDLGPSDAQVYGWIGEKYKDLSPLHNIKPETPPTIMFYGTEDGGISMEASAYFCAAMKAVGSRCDLIIYEGQEHGFFNLHRSAFYFKETILEADRFLISLGYLEGEPTIMKNE
jgi:acetyl esterase/lipase